MSRYFVEVAYKGTKYAGFQIQKNAETIQSHVESVLKIFYNIEVNLTGASRTDAGVHAFQNFFHFDADEFFRFDPLHLYNFNSLLPDDIVINSIKEVDTKSHCRFDAISRSYEYLIYDHKDPFLKDLAFFYPYPLFFDKLNEAAKIIVEYNDFTSFSKRNTQVNHFNCDIYKSKWEKKENKIIYNVTANRFLRGMVRGLVGTMLKVGTGKISIAEFKSIIENKDNSKADFSVPARGLYLKNVSYPDFPNK